MDFWKKKTFIIAEAGTSHMGDLKKGHELIDAAVFSGADCVKFQVVFADEIIHPDSGMVDLPNGKTPLFNVFKDLEQDFNFYNDLKSYCEKRGIKFLATPFGLKSANLLKQLQTDAVKIASPELNHYPLLEEINSFADLIILSTGVSTVSDIEKALSITGLNTILLHCITSYPAPETEYNLRTLKTLSALFGVRTGVSDHSEDPLLVPLTATALGAVMIEKHITLSDKGDGLDDKIALDPENFRIMTDGIREAETTGAEETFKKLEKLYGRKKVEQVKGTGVKNIAESEKGNYRTTNRSVLAIKTIQAGDIFSGSNIALLRSEKNLTPGLPPDYFEILKGKKAVIKIRSGEGITFSHFIP